MDTRKPVSLTLILTSSLLAQTPLPRPVFTSPTSWKQTVEQVTRFNPPDSFEEKVVFEETVHFSESAGIVTLKHSRIPIESVIASQTIGVPENPTPLIFSTIQKGATWPQIESDVEDVFSIRLRRATTYVPVAHITLPAIREQRLPAATYSASWEKGEVRTLFKESPGLTARGIWKFDEKGRVRSAKIVCENAFAPGGDGSPATFTVVITARKASPPQNR